MRKNRQMPKRMSVMATNSMRFGAIILSFFVMVILNLLSSSSCTQLLKAKGEMEKELDKLEDSCTRESTRWEEMKTAENVQTALLRHGLLMRLPRAEQNVRMKSGGMPYPGQLSLARAKQRKGLATAIAESPVRSVPNVNSRLRSQRRH